MNKKIIILGAGFGGLALANILRKNLDLENEIIVIDKKNYFLMGLANLWILNGTRNLADSKIQLSRLEKKGIIFINDEVIAIDPQSRTIQTSKEQIYGYDFLILALGSELAPEKVPGFIKHNCFNIYDCDQVPELRKAILSLSVGRIAIAIMGVPYKCPPAPFETAFIVDEILRTSNNRDKFDIDLYIPSSIPLPVAGKQVNSDLITMLSEHRINLFPNYSIKQVISYNEIEFHNQQKRTYDILIGIPPHIAPSVLYTSNLVGKYEKWITVDRNYLTTKFNDVFAIGDVVEIKINENVALPKAGIFAERQAQSVASQIINQVINNNDANQNILQFDGKGFCFMDTGNKKAGFIDTDFYNKQGPITVLEPPSIKSYTMKINFEQERINEWL